MTDIFSKRKRSDIMSRVRSRGNQSTELALASALRRWKVAGWRRHPPLTGHPDFCFPGLQLAIFVDGCFWHGCAQHGTMPATHRNFWKAKITRNKRRDLKTKRLLRSQGWKVVRIWEHELKVKGPMPRSLQKVLGPLIPANGR